jgi:peptidoglycan/xylan/chitin deacetylase (PgdA/CDA1 family)
MKMPAQVFLQSPFLLYRPEIGTQELDAPPGTVHLSDFEIATRLSYLFWNTMPDEILLAAAERGQLHTKIQIVEQALRLLSDPRARSSVRSFFRQWLELSAWEPLAKDPAVYPEFDEALERSMRAETETFVEHVIWNGDGRFDTLLTADFSFLDLRLARLYGREAALDGAGGRPAPALVVSGVIHAAVAVAVVVQPAAWPWALAAIVANYLVLVAAVLFPRGQVLGPNLVRLPAAAAARNEVSLCFDDGPDPEVTPRVLDLLERHQARASFFCVGRRAAAHPDLVKEIARRGHSVENHSQRHSHAFAFYGLRGLRREVDEAQSAIAGLTGRAPAYFRAPAGFRSPLLDPVLAARGLRYASWTRRGFDTVEKDPAAVLRRLTRGLEAGDMLLLHDGFAARTRAGEPVVLAVLPALLELLAQRGLKPVTLPAAFRDVAGA